MKHYYLVNPLVLLMLMFFLLNIAASCKAQGQNIKKKQVSSQKFVEARCDGCEVMWVGAPARIDSKDTSAGWKEPGQKLIISGKIFRKDGRTAAPNVIVYYYHTDNEGYYSNADGLPAEAKRHGHLRGWVKSDEAGNYAIYTIRPAPYPKENIPAHVHLLVKEPEIANEYYVDELVFDDDKLVTPENKRTFENRGGSGILKVNKKNQILTASHDIILGLNIPGYPDK
ncbi:dioxygenase family protein [Flavitalea antarctica]